MIFVTVGTHEQPFNRLIKEIDQLVKEKKIKEKVVIQTGFSTYKPLYCDYKPMLSFNEMKENIQKSHIVITHGGPSSFVEVLQAHKIPIVVPRKEKFNEHINDHQVEFVKLVYEKNKNIIPVFNISNLENAILNYDQIVKEINIDDQWNNISFNCNIEKLANELLE